MVSLAVPGLATRVDGALHGRDGVEEAPVAPAVPV
jgi:hypothetical protein